MVINGFPQETPQGSIMMTWHFGGCARPIRSLSSSLHIRCGSASQARAVVATVREAPMRCTFHGKGLTLRASVEKTRHKKDRTRRLMKMCAELQTFATTDAKDMDTWKLVCWRSASLVFNDTRVLQLSCDLKTVTLKDNCWDSDRFPSANATIESAIQSALDEDIANSHA